MQNYEYTVDEIAELLGVTKGRAYKGVGRRYFDTRKSIKCSKVA